MISEEDFMKLRNASLMGDEDIEYRSLSSSCVKQLLDKNHPVIDLEFDRSKSNFD
jgi:hypothetical protein